MSLRGLLLLWLLIGPLCAQDGAQKKLNWIPMDYVSVQFAGNLGMLAVGAGNLFFDGRYAFEFYYGYTPRTVSEVAISTISIKNNYNPGDINFGGYTLQPYLGLGLIYSPNQRYNPNWMDSVPNDYYRQLALHVIGYGGACLMFPASDSDALLHRFGAYVELGTVDVYLVDYFSDHNALGLEDIFNVAVGLRMVF